MVNMRRGIIASIIGAGIFLLLAVFLLFDLIGEKRAERIQAPQWTQPVGVALGVPACGSSSAKTSCQGGSPKVNFSWSAAGPAPDGRACSSVTIKVNSNSIASGLPCNGSYTWSGASPNTTYSYSIEF